jgi:hypothetical protein
LPSISTNACLELAKFAALAAFAAHRPALMAAHEIPRTAKLYDRTGDEITLDEVERILI